ncbi:MAG TPA: HAMP domain-containing sensor histidine kinase [Streptosporangiaceae bacterium]|nr:HAMP domain-containing sensor histidine kinase [Streptosporangiaceae bacterium]
MRDAAASRVAGARRWLAGRTLRGRLIAGLLTLLALACATVGAVTYAHLHSVLVSGLNSELQLANARYVDCLMGPPPGSHDGGGGSQHPAAPHSPGPGPCAQQQNADTLNAVFSTGGTLLAANLANSDVCRLSPADRALLTSLPLGQPTSGRIYGPRPLELSHYGDYQVMARDTRAGVVVTGMPLTSVTNTLSEVALAEIAVFSAALLLTGIIGTAWVRASLRPLRRVSATAARVTQLPLASGEVSLPERVPDADPRTEVGQVGAAFNRMLGHVESALARREASESRLRTFAADASHELRTPLAAIRGYAELARRHPGPLPGDLAHALSRVESESARMSELVDELLLLARLDAGRPLASEPVDMTRLVIDVTSDARVAAGGHRWQLELPEEPVIVRGDDLRLHQVLANLLSNAARHTPAGTVVTVSLARLTAGPDAGGAGVAVISVTDDGPGIPAELQPAVFERFVRGDTARSPANSGSGLGLAIVHAVTVAHGGTARVASRPGETRFSIELPVLDDAGDE